MLYIGLHLSLTSLFLPLDSRLYNLLAERRKELQQLQRVADGLEHAAEVQRRAEQEQSYVRPELEERLQKAKLEALGERKRLLRGMLTSMNLV